MEAFVEDCHLRREYQRVRLQAVKAEGPPCEEDGPSRGESSTATARWAAELFPRSQSSTNCGNQSSRKGHFLTLFQAADNNHLKSEKAAFPPVAHFGGSRSIP